MSLQNLLDLSSSRNKKIGLSEERVIAAMPAIRDSIAFFREYPDLLVDFIKGPNSTFRFYFYQRVFLRVTMRHRKVYATFPRAFSKSFLSMMVLMLRCILYPGCELFITTGGKEQAASITVAKIDEICRLIPALNNEINWDRGVSKKSKDNVEYVFKNGSKINILAARESSRGQRRTGRNKIFFTSLWAILIKISSLNFILYVKIFLRRIIIVIGFIYHIRNKINGKEYIGQTIDIDWRLKKHFLSLEKGTHHSIKFQRAFDKYGKDAFEVSYIQQEFNSYQELLLEEIKEIDKFNSFDNGYNETRGGEGRNIIFDFNTMVLLYHIGKRYDGIKHKLAEYYNCDRTSITAIFRKDYLDIITYNEEDLQQLISELGLTSSNLKENYKNNYDRKLTTEQVLKILSTIEIKKFSQSACGKVYGVNKDVIGCIIRGKTYKEDYQQFLKLSLEQKEQLAEEMCNTTDVIRLHYQGQRGPVKNPLTQEQVNYILNNLKNKTQAQIAKDLNISVDRVSAIKNRRSYLDMIWVYEKEHSSN